MKKYTHSPQTCLHQSLGVDLEKNPLSDDDSKLVVARCLDCGKAISVLPKFDSIHEKLNSLEARVQNLTNK